MTYTFDPVSIPAATSGRGGPLSYQIMASIVSGREFSDKIIITQDNLDDLRQEYLDIRHPTNPLPLYPITAFLQVAPPAQWSNLLNRGQADVDGPDDGFDERHQWWLNLTNLIGHANQLDQAIGGGLNETSGYRCPAGNVRVGGTNPSLRSYHIRARALDYDQLTDLGNWNVWNAADNLNTVENRLYNLDGHYIPIPGTGVYPQNIPTDGSLIDSEGHPVTGYDSGHVAW